MRNSLVAAVLTLVTPIAAGAQGPPASLVTGEAFSADGRLAYRVFHTVGDDGAAQQVTTYRDEQGREFGRMDADYSTYRYSPVYRMADHRQQTLASVTRNGNLVHVERTVKGVTTGKTLRYSGGRELIVGPGLDAFVKAHWDTLLAGHTVRCDLVVPSRMQILAFRISHVAGASIPTSHRFAVKADNFFVRLLAPALNVEYDRVTHDIQSYEGPSNVNDAADHPQAVTIRFSAPVATLVPTITGAPR